MALISKEITRLLTEASSQRSTASLNEAFNSIKQLMEQAVVVDVGKTMQASNDLYLFCCETAVQLEQWPIALHCADRLVESVTTTKAYQIRTLFCRAAIDVEKTRSMRGKELVASVQAALSKIVLGMKSALQDASQLSHLVALGATHIWNVGRSLFKDGTYSDVVSAIGFAVWALEKIEFQDWSIRIVWLLRHSSALAGSSRLAEANTVLQKAADLTAKYLPNQKYAVYRMQVAMSKAVPNPKVKQDAVKGVLRAIYAAQAVFCGLAEGAAADTDLVGAYNEIGNELGILSNAAAPASPGVPIKPSTAPQQASPRGAAAATSPQSQQQSPEELALKEEVLAELGLALALNGDADRASECAKAALKSRALKARVIGEYTASLVKAIRCGGMAVQLEANSNALTSEMVAELVSAIREVDRTLESAQRISDTSERNHIVQYGCVLVWNMSLPILQPNTRGQIARCLQNAAKHLEDIGSNMVMLRTLLYYEAALTDVDSDFLNKASTKIEKALSMDYNPEGDDQRVYSLLRPLDRFLVWMKRKLDVRGNLYAKPDNVEDEALIVIEQARGAPVANRLAMLSRAVSLLRDSEPPSDYFNEAVVAQKIDDPKSSKSKAAPAGKKGKGGEEEDTTAVKADPAVEARRNHVRVRSQLWYMILEAAWAEKSTLLITVVREAANALLSRQWSRRADRDVRQQQALAYFALADVSVVELASQNLYVAQRKFFDTDESDDADADEDGEEESGEPQAAKSSNGKAQKSSSKGSALTAPLDEQAMIRRVEELSTLVQNTEKMILTQLMEGAKIGADLVQQGFDDMWIVANSATLLWNYHTKAYEQNDFLAPLPALEQMYAMMFSVHMDPKKETSLMRDTCLALVQGLVQQFVRDKLTADPQLAHLTPNAVALQATRVSVPTFTKIEPGNAKLLKAWEVCDKMISVLPTPMDAKAFLMWSASIQRLLGKPLDQRAHPQQRLLILIEQLRHPLGVEEKRNVLNNQALDLLNQDPNMELCARLAAASLAIPDNDRVTVRIASIGSQLYSDGKLGWKQNEIAAVAAAAGKGGAKDAKKGTDVAAPADATQKTVDVPIPTQEDWHWYSLLLQYQGIAMAQLVNPVLQEKPTQWDIRSRALTSLTNSAMASVQGLPDYRGLTIRKALRLYRNICQELASDAVSRALALPSLGHLLSEKILRYATLSAVSASATQSSDLSVLAELFVLNLICLRDSESVEEGLQVLKLAMKYLPASLHKPFWGFDIQFRCTAGLPTNQTLLRVKEYAPETQAQVWVVFSKYAKTVEDQRYALQSAVDVLAGKPAEQAAHLLVLAQWMLQSNYPVTIDVLIDIIMYAIDLVGSAIDTEAEEDASAASDAASSVGGGTTVGRQSLKQSLTDGLSTTAKSKTLGSRSVASQVGHAKKKGDKARASVKALRVALEAYYLLSRIAGSSATAVSPAGDANLDCHTALRMVVHYTMRILSITIASANAHNQKQKAKAIRAQRLAAASGVPTTLDPNAVPSEFDIPTSVHSWIGFTLPPQLSATLKAMRSTSAVTPATVDNVECFLRVLDDVTSQLCREGLELQAHPVLNLMKLLIDVCVPGGMPLSVSMSNVVQSQLYQAATAAGVGSLAVVHRVNDPYLPTNDVLALHEDARIAAQRHGDTTDASKKKKDGAVSSVMLQDVDTTAYIHKYWAALGRNLLLEGRIASAKEYLGLAQFHASAHGDRAGSAAVADALAKILLLEGKTQEALDGIQAAIQQYGSVISAQMWLDMKLFEIEVLLKLQRIDEALQSAKLCSSIVRNQPVFCAGLIKDVAERVVPELECAFLVRCTSKMIAALRTDGQHREDVAKLRMDLVWLLRRAVERAAELPSMKAHGFLLEVEISRLEAEVYEVDSSRKLSAKKQRLCRESQWLSRAVAAAKQQLMETQPPAESIASAAFPRASLQLASVWCALGQNLLERVELNSQMLFKFRSSQYTTLQYPVVEGAPSELEKDVVYFMRSSRKQRAADVRKAQRAKQQKIIETQREAARREKQAEIDKRRELRKAELEALLKKDPKAKPNPKNAQAFADEPDVDPNDKCGILSQQGSDDEGHGEDSQSDEEEELRLALRDLPAEQIESEQRINYGSAVECFLAASELTTEPYSVNSEAKLGAAVAMMRSYERSTLDSERRESLLRGENAEILLRSRGIEARWNRPIEIGNDEDVATKSAPGTKKKEDAKKPPGKGGKDTGVAATTSPVLNAVADPKKLSEMSMILSFSSIMESVIRQAISATDTAVAQRALVLYAEALVLASQTQAAGLAIETAQAYAMSKYAVEVWKSSAFADATEVALWNAMDTIKNDNAAMMASPHYQNITKAQAAQSKMASRLRVPVHSWGQPAVNDVVPFSTDVCTLTVLRVDGRDDAWVLAFRRPSGVVDVRYANVALEALLEQQQVVEEAENSRGDLLAHEKTDVQTLRHSSNKIRSAVTALLDMLDPFFAPFQVLLESLASKAHLVLCLDPVLLPLPFELHRLLVKLRSVQRDLSVPVVSAKLQRRAVDRYTGTSATLIIDPRREQPGAVAAALGDEKPKNPNWVLLTATMDENKQYRYPSVAQVQRAMTNTAASTILVDMCSRFTSLFPIQSFASLQLDHVRVAIWMDRGSREVSCRRELQSEMAKTPKQLWVEKSWNTAVVLLARGVEFVAINRTSSATGANDLMCRTALSNMEKPQIKSFAEVMGQALKKIVDDEDAAVEATPVAQSSKTPASEWVPMFADSVNVAFYGLCTDEVIPVTTKK